MSFRFAAAAAAAPQAAAAAAAPIAPPTRTPIHDDYVALATPTQAQTLQELTALPTAMLGLAVRGATRGKKGTRKVVQKYYDIMGMNKPVPRNGISLTQSIRVEFQVDFPAFLVTNTLTPASATIAFAMNTFPGTAAFATAFDQYKFEQVEVWLEPTHARDSDYRVLATCIDLDDASNPSSLQDVEDRQGSLSGYGATGRYHKWSPHMAIAAYSGAFTSFANAPASWIDVASPSVQHYGFKSYANPTGSAITYSLQARAVIIWRSPTI